jgi:PAS domain S-box-containing protein
MKISRKISLSFLVVALILALSAGSIYYAVAKGVLVKSISNDLSAVCSSRARHIETYLKMLEVPVVQASRSPILQDLLKISGKGEAPQYEAFKKATKRLEEGKEAGSSISEFLLMDRTGKVAASSDESGVGRDRSQDAVFLGAQKELYIKDPYIPALSEKPLMAVSAPVSDSLTGEFLGVVAGKVDLEKLNSIVADKTGLGETGEIYIVNKHGYMITPSRTVKDAFLRQRVDSDNLGRARLHKGKEHPLSEKEMGKAFTDYRGVKVFGAHEYIPGIEWTVLAEMDEKEALEPVAKLRLVFLLIVFFTPLVAWVLGGIIARTITNPLSKLHRGTEFIARGDLDHKVGTGDNDEVGQLSRAFDDMTESLRKKTASIDTLNKEISQRKKAKEEYRSMKKNMDFVLKAAKITLDILDPDLNIIYVDEMWKEVYGDYTGRKCHEYFMGRSQACPECGAKKALETKKIVRSEEVLVREGNRPVEVISISFQDEKGKWLVAEVNVDITERKRAEEGLRESEKRFMDVFYSSDDAILLIGDNKFVDCNQATARMLGYPAREEFLQTHPSELSPPKQPDGRSSREKADEMMKDALEKGFRRFEWMHRRASGEDFPVEVSLTPVVRKGEKMIYCVWRDITGRKQTEESLTRLLKEEIKHREVMTSMLDDNNRIRERLEEKLEEVQKFQQQIIQSEKLASLGRMVAEIAHEINNPLQAVSGNAQLLMLEDDIKGTVTKGLKIIEQQCYRARDIIKRLLLFAKPAKMSAVEKDINEVAEDAIKLIEISLHLSNVRILREYAREEIKVEMDVVQIEEVFMNLLRNSMEAMDKGGTITVSTGSKGNKAWVSIKDTGSGMTEETKEHIFDPFYTTKDTGTGLGLSVCFGIVKAHGGEIMYESAPGEGTKAVVFLPKKA